MYMFVFFTYIVSYIHTYVHYEQEHIGTYVRTCTYVCSVLPRYLKACRSNMPSLVDIITFCRKTMHAFIDY